MEGEVVRVYPVKWSTITAIESIHTRGYNSVWFVWMRIHLNIFGTTRLFEIFFMDGTF